MANLCQPFFWEDITVIFRTPILLNTQSCDGCVSEMVNQILLIYILGFLLGFPLSIATGARTIFIVPIFIATLFAIPTFFRLMTPGSCKKESFNDVIFINETPAPTGRLESGRTPTGMTVPTARNPFMNVSIDEYKYNPMRPPAAQIDNLPIRMELDDFFRTEFTRDPTDVFGRTQSQRQFITEPASTIPNDGGSFQNWLYKIPGKTCKEGGREACFPGTDGGVVPWLSSPV
jgi:hypothetical protein